MLSAKILLIFLKFRIKGLVLNVLKCILNTQVLTSGK